MKIQLPTLSLLPVFLTAIKNTNEPSYPEVETGLQNRLRNQLIELGFFQFVMNLRHIDL